MKKRRFFKVWGARKHKFYYLGKHRWYNPHYKGRIFFFSKKRNSFISPAPKGHKNLSDLKAFWKKRMASKKYKGYKYYHLSDGKNNYKVRHKGSLASLKAWWSDYRHKKYGL